MSRMNIYILYIYMYFLAFKFFTIAFCKAKIQFILHESMFVENTVKIAITNMELLTPATAS